MEDEELELAETGASVWVEELKLEFEEAGATVCMDDELELVETCATGWANEAFEPAEPEWSNVGSDNAEGEGCAATCTRDWAAVQCITRGGIARDNS